MEILSVEQAAREIGVSPRRVRQFCKAGRLGQRVGGRWVIARESLQSFTAVTRPTGRPRKEK